MLGGKFENFLAHNDRGFIDRITCDDRPAAGERPCAPIELIGVACDDIDFIYFHTKLLRDDLCKTCEVTLSLRANTGDDRDSSAAHHLHFRAFVWSDACAFYICHDADADMFAFSP